MKLVSFSVQNYRSLVKTKKLPIGDMTVLLGPNNEGKSNILRAMVCAIRIVDTLDVAMIKRDGRIYFPNIGEQNFYRWEEDFPISLQAANPDGNSIFTLEFSLMPEEVAEFKKEVKSNLNGTLPIEIHIGKTDPAFRVVKKGPGGKALSDKRVPIAKFIGKRFALEYFPTVRSANTAGKIIERMIARDLQQLQETEEYKEALRKVRSLQQPILNQIATGLNSTLKEFLPSIQNFEIEISESRYFRAFNESYELIVDDGTRTKLSNKGDGIQSLVALGLMRHRAEKTAIQKYLILAIEEPESHLHPRAIHTLRAVLDEISKEYQVILTTHSPLFVNRTRISSNIIVEDGRAVPAVDTQNIRQVLGVKTADNLTNSDLILLVEGEDDRLSIAHLLSLKSPQLANAIREGLLAIDSLNGGSNLSYKLGLFRDRVSVCHVFLDGDEAGKTAIQEAIQEKLLNPADYQVVGIEGQSESEFEDLIDESFYGAELKEKYGIDIFVTQFRGNKKWSERMRKTAQHQGKVWSDNFKAQIKNHISSLVAKSIVSPVSTHYSGAIDSLGSPSKRGA